MGFNSGFKGLMIDDERTYIGTRLLKTTNPNLPLLQPFSCEELDNRTSLK